MTAGTHTLRLAQKAILAPRPVGLWAWSLDKDADLSAYNGGYFGEMSALNAATTAIEEDIQRNAWRYEKGEHVRRTIYLLRFAWADKACTKRLPIEKKTQNTISSVDAVLQSEAQNG